MAPAEAPEVAEAPAEAPEAEAPVAAVEAATEAPGEAPVVRCTLAVLSARRGCQSPKQSGLDKKRRCALSLQSFPQEEDANVKKSRA